MYLKLNSKGEPKKYSIGLLRRDNPNVSLPKAPSDELLETYGVYAYTLIDRSIDPETQYGKPHVFKKVSGAWVLENVVLDMAPEDILRLRRERMVCSSLQGKIAIGEAGWARVTSYRDEPDTPFSVKVTIDDSPTWSRLSQDIKLIGWALGYTDEQMDDLFTIAMKIDGS